jgi:hypothetical protein
MALTHVPGFETIGEVTDPFVHQVAAEVWRDIPRFPQYQASSLGRIRRNGATVRVTREALTPSLTPLGYHIVRPMRDGHPRSQFVHRLVCEAFHGPAPTDEHEVAHDNGIRIDNRPANLRWATALENAADRDAHGRTTRGEATPWAVITESDAQVIKRLLAEDLPIPLIARAFQVSNSVVSGIKKGRNWKRCPTRRSAA